MANCAMCAHLNQAMANRGNLWPWCENPVCPDLVWKPVIYHTDIQHGGKFKDHNISFAWGGAEEAPERLEVIICLWGASHKQTTPGLHNKIPA